MLDEDFINFRTNENTTVYIQKSAIGAIEDTQASQRAEGSTLIYTAGYKFRLKGETTEEFLGRLGITPAEAPAE